MPPCSDKTGGIRLPWRPEEPCPCQSGLQFGICCRLPDGNVFKVPVLPTPPPPVTGHMWDGCYMGSTRNCSSSGSREHFISRTVLALIGEDSVKVSGVPWLPADEARALSLKSLAANILCERHNAALSPLDTSAGRFFGALKDIYADLENKKSISRKRLWYLFSGEELELWLFKTALGLFHSGNAAKSRVKLAQTQAIHPDIVRVFSGAAIPSPCGMHVLRVNPSTTNIRSHLIVEPGSSDGGERMIALRLTFMGFGFVVLLDPQASYSPEYLQGFAHRPSRLIFKGKQRTHTIVLTWRCQSGDGVIYPVAR